jgi:flagellar motor switch protein FliM
MTTLSDDDIPSPRPEISSAELDALLQKPGAVQVAPKPGAVESYDLLSSDKIVRGRMPALDRLNERWVGEFQRAVRELIRQPVEVALQPAQLTPYGDWQAATPSPTSFNLYSVKPWSRQALLAVEGQLLFVLVDSYYGGAVCKAAAASRDKLTPTEQRLNRILVDLGLEHFRRAFAPIAALEFQHVQTEINPQYVTLATTSEAVVVTRLDLACNGVGGAISLVIPLSAFDSVKDKLAEGLKTVSAETRQRWQQSLRAQLEHTELTLSTVFLEDEITMRELLQLKPGDVLPIEMPKTATLYAGSQPLLSGKFGRSRGYNAVAIVEAVKTAPHPHEEAQR